MLQNMIVRLRGVDAGERRISLEDCIGILTRPIEEPLAGAGSGQREQWRLIEQDIAVDPQGMQRCPALLESFD